MRQRSIDGLLDDTALVTHRSRPIPYRLLQLPVVDVHMLTTVFFEAFDVLIGEVAQEGLDGQGKDDHR